MVLYPNKLPESERVCSGICIPSNDPNVRYIEKNFSVCPNKEVIEKVRTHVNIYEDSIRYHNEMIQMAAIKDSIANSLFKEANEIKKKINKQ